MTNQQTPSPTDPGDLTQPRVEPTGGESPPAVRLDLAMARINTVSTRIQAATTRTLLIGILLLATISGISVSGLSQVDKQLDPKLAAPRIKQFLEDRGVPVFRRYATDVVRNNSRSIARQLNQKALDHMPRVRKQLEDHAVDELNKSIDESTPLTEKKLVAMLRQHRPQLEKTFNRLGSPDEEVSNRAVQELVAVLEVGLQTNFKDDARILLATLYHVNARNRRILANQDLTAEENLIRQVIASYRGIAKDAAAPAPE